MEATYKGKVADAGRVVIPAELREALGLKVGSEVIFSVEPDGLRIMPVELALKRAQDFVCSLVPPDVMLSEELLKDRRLEERREGEELSRDLARKSS